MKKSVFVALILLIILFINWVYAAGVMVYPIYDKDGKPHRIDINDPFIKETFDRLGISGIGLNDEMKVTSKENIIWEMGYHPTKEGSYKIKIKGNEYNFMIYQLSINDPKINPNLVFDKNNELTEGTHFVVGTGGGVFRLKGSDIKLPEKSKVLFENDKITIELADGSKLDTISIINKGQALGSKFVFKSGEKGFNLPGGDLFIGKTLTFEVDKEGKSSFYFFDKEASLDGLKASNPEGYRVDLDLKGQVSKSYAGNYISIDTKNSKLVIGKNNPGAGIMLEKTGENIIYQAGKDADKKDKAGGGTIVVDTKEKTKVETYGDFKIKNGEMAFRTGIDANGMKNLFTPNNINKNGKESSYMEITSYNENGNLLAKNQKIITDNKNGFRIDNVKSEQTTLSRETPNQEEKPRVSFNEVGVPTRTSLPQGTTTNNPLNYNLITKGTGIKINPNSNVLQLLESLTNDRDSGNGDILTKVHEEGHFANTDVTSREGVFADYSVDKNKARSFLTGEINPQTNEPVQFTVSGTGVAKSQVADYVPESFRDSYYSLYFGSVHSNKDAVHVFEDLSTYHLETKYSAETLMTTDTDGAANEFKSVIHAAAAGIYLSQNDPGYWNSQAGTQFKAALKWGAEESIKYLPGGTSSSLVQKLDSNPDTKNMRKFFTDTYGPAWTQRVLGF